MAPAYIEPIKSENFGYLPWAEWDPNTFDPITKPPERYFNTIFDTYKEVCGDSTADTTPFITMYANYAGSFENGSFWRRLSYFSPFNWNKTRWVHNDVKSWLGGGRRCPEGTPGYEKFMPQSQDARLRSVAKAMLATGIFHFDSEKNTVVFDEEILDLDFDSERASRRLAAGAGFREIRPDDPTRVYRNGTGDLLIIGRESISWGSADNLANLGVRIVVNDDAVSSTAVEVFLLRKGAGSEHPLLEHAEEAATYIDEISDYLIPGRGSHLPLGEIMAAFGYSYSGSEDPSVVGDYFLRAAMNYEFAAGRWLAEADGDQSEGIRRVLLYKAAEQYYLAVVAHLAAGNFTTAASMLDQMGYHLSKIGVDYEAKLRMVERALGGLSERSYRRNTGGPQGGNGILGGGTASQLPEMSSADVPMSGASAMVMEQSDDYHFYGVQTGYRLFLGMGMQEDMPFRAFEFAR